MRNTDRRCICCKGTGYAGPYGDTCRRCEGCGVEMDDRTDEEIARSWDDEDRDQED